MGATVRLATSLGLHRDYSESITLPKKEKAAASIELRRRIWWCIVCLDSWASISLGRPSMGRMNHAVTAKVPQQPIGISTEMLLLLQENARFSWISTRQEDALSVSPIIDETERKTLDTAYVDWFKISSVHDDTPRPSNTEAIGISVMKSIMRWRYLWCRVVLHRPVLLWYAMRKMPFSKLTDERRATIELCRELTSELINDIAMTWAGRNRCIMSAWHAAWLLYQATMVPLLSLFSDKTDRPLIEKSHAQIQTAMHVLSEQIDYAYTAKRCLEVVGLIYEAGTRQRSNQEPVADDICATNMSASSLDQQTVMQFQRPSYIDFDTNPRFPFGQQLDTPHQEMIMDNMFDSLNWSTGWTDGSQDWVDFDRLGFPYDYFQTGTFDDHHLTSMPPFGPEYGFDQVGSSQMEMDQ